MARPREGARVLGPTEVINSRGALRYRVTVVGEDGSRRSRNLRTEAAAKAYKAEQDSKLGQIQAATVESVIIAYKQRCLLLDCGNNTTERALEHLYNYFGPVLQLRITSLTSQRCLELYAGKYVHGHPDPVEDGVIQRKTRFGTPPAVATQQNCLSAVKKFLQWCAENQYFEKSPAAGIKKLGGEPNVGKKRLKTDDGRKFTLYCMEAVKRGDAGAVAGLLAILVGMRAGEIAALTPGGIDNDGRTIIVWRGKTKKSQRELGVGAEYEPGARLRQCLLSLSRGKDPDEPIFGYSSQNNVRTKDWTYDQVIRLCTEAGVPVVSPHGLRGSHATGATQEGATAELMMKSMGWASMNVSRAYVAAGAKELATQRGLMAKFGFEVLEGGRSAGKPKAKKPARRAEAPGPIEWTTRQRKAWTPEQKKRIVAEYEKAPPEQRASILIKHGVGVRSSLVHKWKRALG